MAIIIGTYYEYVKLTYEGREQSNGLFYAASLPEAVEKAISHKNMLMKAYGDHPCYLYQNKDGWQIFRVTDRLEELNLKHWSQNTGAKCNCYDCRKAAITKATAG
jgi:hypothetical protein